MAESEDPEGGRHPAPGSRPDARREPDPLRALRRRDGHFERVARPRMTDLTAAAVAPRWAVAEAEVRVAQSTLSAIIDGVLGKGDVLSVAELAGVMGGKRAAELIPLLHPTSLANLFVQAAPDRAGGVVRVRVEAAATGPASVGIEALTGAAVAALAIVDMISEIDVDAEITGLRIVSSSEAAARLVPRPETPQDRARPRGARVAGRIMNSRVPNPATKPTHRHRSP